MKKKIALIAVFVLLISAVTAFSVSAADVWDGTAAEGFASGTGTEEDPFVIMTAEQLKYFADQVNAGDSYSGKFIKLGSDILLNDTSNWENWNMSAPKNTWTAIGSYFKYFEGTFDGNGYTVSGICIYSDYAYEGLFGYAHYATIKNLGIEKSYIKGQNGVGGVVGSNFEGTVINCYNTGTVSGSKYTVGGVVGFNSGTVTNCYNTGAVSGSFEIGGVVGSNTNEGATVVNCYNTGAVSGSFEIGGVVGISDNNADIISNCYNTGTVSGSVDRIGGVVGLSTSSVSNCFYLVGCAKDGNGTEQYGIGRLATDETTGDVSGETTGLTDAQMKQKASFAGFDFDTVWTIGVLKGYDYPTLRWEKSEHPVDSTTEPDETTTEATETTPVTSETTEATDTEAASSTESGTKTDSDSKDDSNDSKKSSFGSYIIIIGAVLVVLCIALLIGFGVIVKK